MGWLLTINGYYDERVRYIYDTVVKALSQNSARKFISVEMAFFHKWWHDKFTTSAQQEAARKVRKYYIYSLTGSFVLWI